MNVELTKYVQQSDSYQKALEKSENAPNAAATRAGKGKEAAAAPQGDRVSLSNDARLRTQAFSTAMSAPDVRQERVDALKTQVDSGTYVVDSRKVAEKLLQEETELFG